MPFTSSIISAIIITLTLIHSFTHTLIPSITMPKGKKTPEEKEEEARKRREEAIARREEAKKAKAEKKAEEKKKAKE